MFDDEITDKATVYDDIEKRMGWQYISFADSDLKYKICVLQDRNFASYCCFCGDISL